MTDVFISYSRPDLALAKSLAADLSAKGVVVWWDSELLSGEDFRAAILTRLREAKAVIVIWSHQSIDSRWVCEEAEEAAQSNKLIAVGAPKFDPRDVPLGLRSFQVVPIDNREGIFAAVTAAREGRLNAHRPLQRKTLLELWLERAHRNWVALAAGTAASIALALAVSPMLLGKTGGATDLFSSATAEEEKGIALGLRLDREFQAAVQHRRRPLTLADFKAPLATIEELSKLEKNNGHVPYFSALIQRYLETPEELSEQVHDGYYRYLELVDLLPSSITRTGPAANFCYTRPLGFCTQRTAWIHHQMALDHLAWAAKADDAARRVNLGHALNHARAALCLRPEGFLQIKSTALIVAEVERELAVPHQACPK
jgi:hypothetical protein